MKVLTEKEIDDIRTEAKADALKEAAERLCKICVGELDPNTCKNCPDRAAILADEPPKRGLKEAVDSIRERWGKDFDALADDPQTACTWSRGDEDRWLTGCGILLDDDGDPGDVKYCAYCGKPVRIAD